MVPTCPHRPRRQLHQVAPKDEKRSRNRTPQLERRVGLSAPLCTMLHGIALREVQRPLPDSNRGWRICNPKERSPNSSPPYVLRVTRVAQGANSGDNEFAPIAYKFALTCIFTLIPAGLRLGVPRGFGQRRDHVGAFRDVCWRLAKRPPTRGRTCSRSACPTYRRTPSRS